MSGYKDLLSYKNARIVFALTWEFVPIYYNKHEDARQRDQMRQASRSYKQNLVEGSEDRSLSSKLKLYDVARASGGELLEDYDDILLMEQLPMWDKFDVRLKNFQKLESSPSFSSSPSCSSVLGGTRGIRGTRWTREETEILCNYLIDLIKRTNYLMDQQIRSVEDRHQKEGGYRENLLRRRLEFRKRTGR